MTTTRLFGRSSSAVKARPSAGATPSSGKNDADTSCIGTSSGSPLPGHRGLERHADGGEILERALHLAPVNEVAWRDHVVLPVARDVVLPDDDQPLGILVGKRLQEQRVDHAEDRGVRADADGEGADRDRGEPRRAQEQPRAVAQVPPDVTTSFGPQSARADRSSAARRAGSSVAPSATAVSTTATISDERSADRLGDTSKSRARSSRVRSSAPTRPAHNAGRR